MYRLAAKQWKAHGSKFSYHMPRCFTVSTMRVLASLMIHSVMHLGWRGVRCHCGMLIHTSMRVTAVRHLQLTNSPIFRFLSATIKDKYFQLWSLQSDQSLFVSVTQKVAVVIDISNIYTLPLWYCVLMVLWIGWLLQASWAKFPFSRRFIGSFFADKQWIRVT